MKSTIASILIISLTSSFPAATLAWAPAESTTVRSGTLAIYPYQARSEPLVFRKAVPGADIEQPPVDESSLSEATSSKASDALSDTSVSARGKVNEIDFCIAPADVSLSRAYDAASASSDSTAPRIRVGPEGAAAEPPVLSLTRALNNASNRAVRRILLARCWPSAEALNLSLQRAAAAEKERIAKLRVGTNAGTSSTGAKCPVPRPILNVLTRRGKERSKSGSNRPVPRSRSDEEYVADQLKAFEQRYSSLPGYSYAEAYLESILSLATAGVESPRVNTVIESGVYDEAYNRALAVLKSVGVVMEKDPKTGRSRIAPKLVDKDICLSMLDKFSMKQGDGGSVSLPAVQQEDDRLANEPIATKLVQDESTEVGETGVELTNEDLGGVLLSAKEPSMTRQLNVLANIVERALLFGGDEELLVLSETLDADRTAFVERWYPGTGGIEDDAPLEEETRPGVQFLNCLIQLLRECYSTGGVQDLEPPLPLLQSYANAYERLVAGAVELGSGYLKPVPGNVMTMPKPRTAQEELGRFAVWESTFRKTAVADVSSYPEDLEGTWEVRDEIGGKTIGISIVELTEQGQVTVAPPLEGLRWRLDPGPTHLDTCTFQVLNSDGTILQYRGFIDRGARLESRFSKRPLRIRGSVMFQMRDGSADYFKDMLPINYKTGTTKFVMTKQVKEDEE